MLTKQAKRAGRSQRREGAKRPCSALSHAHTWEGVRGLEGRAFPGKTGLWVTRFWAFNAFKKLLKLLGDLQATDYAGYSAH